MYRTGLMPPSGGLFFYAHCIRFRVVFLIGLTLVSKLLTMPVKYGSIGVMKYESVTKRARNELLYEYYYAHRELSLKEIGVIFGVSKQRVSKIIKREKELAGVAE